MEIVGSGGENGLLGVLFAANASSYRQWHKIHVAQFTSSKFCHNLPPIGRLVIQVVIQCYIW